MINDKQSKTNVVLFVSPASDSTLQCLLVVGNPKDHKKAGGAEGLLKSVVELLGGAVTEGGPKFAAGVLHCNETALWKHLEE